MAELRREELSAMNRQRRRIFSCSGPETGAVTISTGGFYHRRRLDAHQGEPVCRPPLGRC